jgi:hypothetical protein
MDVASHTHTTNTSRPSAGAKRDSRKRNDTGKYRNARKTQALWKDAMCVIESKVCAMDANAAAMERQHDEACPGSSDRLKPFTIHSSCSQTLKKFGIRTNFFLVVKFV